jgi:hypothetical protein
MLRRSLTASRKLQFRPLVRALPRAPVGLIVRTYAQPPRGGGPGGPSGPGGFGGMRFPGQPAAPEKGETLKQFVSAGLTVSLTSEHRLDRAREGRQAGSNDWWVTVRAS